MLRRIEQWLVVTLLVITIGGHWAVLQSAAWAGMLVSYSRAATVQEAWSKTFDGQHPCKLCRIVKTGQAQEKKQDLVKVEIKLESTLAANGMLFLPPKPGPFFRLKTERALIRADAPLLPPPRAT